MPAPIVGSSSGMGAPMPAATSATKAAIKGQNALRSGTAPLSYGSLSPWRGDTGAQGRSPQDIVPLFRLHYGKTGRPGKERTSRGPERTGQTARLRPQSG